MDAILSTLLGKYNYWIYIALMMLGLWAIIAKNNLIKKIIGLNIFQTGIILFYISISAKKDATIPILMHHGGHGGHEAIHAVNYVNPLPQVLMLTAIVVSVATLGVALALSIRLYQRYKSLEEDEILTQLREEQ
ncbi:cation:proton antiporter subunit C [Desulfohalobium retbaense]|uniref:NADH-ubiquinone oxidoreductase chain 4L n=1 Tax=Desulfohalobium retbaense (strain ATCC 49708 / DSM 5692 / JCM 16813 / HR100) TaxID=485915 RepID=C8X0Y7_DESRD|nr:cation:proton antiporter subunit C [Desulfohalobium retbaense]ACV68084.1 NADH-ubiquinone oxidoreductase chain 4L [Desulfohalobium retbaense DSM 5692]